MKLDTETVLNVNMPQEKATWFHGGATNKQNPTLTC